MVENWENSRVDNGQWTVIEEGGLTEDQNQGRRIEKWEWDHWFVGFRCRFLFFRVFMSSYCSDETRYVCMLV